MVENTGTGSTVDFQKLTGKKILIVEDDAFLHNLLADKLEQLRKNGIEVYPTFSGKEALEKAKEVHPDVVLLDVVLPGMNGFEVLEALRKDPELKDVSVIILSNLNQDKDKQRAKELGVTDYMVKANFMLEELVERIVTILEKGK